MRLHDRHVRVNLALQGGGAHGAFTWGVLDRLLEEATLDFGWVSATSAGAVNAVALAAGLAEGGREAARAKLAGVWHAVHKAGVPDFLRINPILYGLSQSGALAKVAGLMSPYELNPLGFDPLRRLLNEHIDFAKVRAASPVELLIAATEVATGRARLFTRAEMTVDAVLASACLPTLHHAVEIDGAAYWDGGFSANPDLVSLARQSPIEDTLIVQLAPLGTPRLPMSTVEIGGAVSRFTFNAPLLRDVALIDSERRLSRGFLGTRIGKTRLARHRFHLIEAVRYTSVLSPATKMKPDLQLLEHLHAAGRTEAHKWLDLHRRKVGRRSSVDIGQHFLRAKESGPVPTGTPVSAGDELPPEAANIR